MPDAALIFAQAAASGSTSLPSPGLGAITALVLFIVASVWLGTVAQRVVERSQFIQGYFQGNRGLGAWTIALTATVQSGGTFMGFPSLVYTYGWIVAVWIGSYMVVPLTGFAIIGKRIAQISRRTGAVTMPDLFRARYGSPAAGLVCSLLIIVFMTIMMFAQFKAGAVVMKIAWPGTGVLALSEEPNAPIDKIYLIGLAIFSLTVVGYTLIGGFLAAVWTDLLQSVMMFIGVMILVVLALWTTGGLEPASRKAVEVAGPAIASGPGIRPNGDPFLPLTMAFSFFCFWPFAGMASPASIVRIMACKDTRVLRQSIFLLAIYNMCIYLPLIMICICAKAKMPGLAKPDEVIPRMALALTADFPLGLGSWVSGLILAAPFGAIMATVSCYLLVIASGLVRDVYQRFLYPAASEHELRRLTYLVMIVIGAVAVVLNIFPVKHLQTFVVISSGCAASSFLMPTLMMCYWRRATAAGTIAAMLSGAAASSALNIAGLIIAIRAGKPSEFHAYELLGFDPLIWGLASSLLLGIVVSLITIPPEERLISKLFDVVAPQPS
ncbi:MAG TPA: sodium:solute symporter [Pirellulaceae bacterium]|jgi:SSS family solute:Na+ symporter/sodium/pantothenate symporter